MKQYILAALVVALGACQGNIGATGDPEERVVPELEPTALSGGRLRARLWPLTPTQYEELARSLLGELPDAGQYPEGSTDSGFSNIAANLTFERAATQRLVQISDDYARWAETNGPTASGCGDRFPSDACIDEFIERFGTGAFRRPLEDDERTSLRALFDGIAEEHGPEYGFRRLVQTILLSPQVIYRAEIGAPFDGPIVGTPPEGGEIVVLDDYEIASLMSFALTNAPPDEALLEAAAAGRLRDADERAAQASRLMDQSHDVWRTFFWEWLHMSRFDPQVEALAIDGALAAAMREEYEEFIGRVVVDERGTLDDVFTSASSWASPELAEFYGVSHSGSGLQPIDFDPSERAGVLTQAAWLVSHGSRDDEYVVRRGMGVFLETLCRDLTPPDIDVNAAQAELTALDASAREKSEARQASDICGACHRVPDNIGLAFEAFDAMGRARSEYLNGEPIDSNATVPGIGSVESAADLGYGLVEATEFQTCFVRRVAHKMLGADLGENSAWINDVMDEFIANDRSIEALVLALVRHPGFIERSKGGE